MKLKHLFIAFVLVPFLSNATTKTIEVVKVNEQLEDYATYNMSFLHRKYSETNEILSIKLVKNEECTFFVESIDKDTKKGSSRLLKEDYFLVINNPETFIASLRKVKQKFIEWDQLAVSNNVKVYEKKMEISFPYITVVDRILKNYTFFDNIEVVASFIVDENGDSRVEVFTNSPLESGWINGTPQKIVFSSEYEINNFIDTISPLKAKQKLNKNKKNDEIFK